MTQLDELLRTLRLPSLPTLALYAATLVAEVPVIFTRMLLTLAVAVIVLLSKGQSLAGAGSLAELALIPTGWAIFAIVTPFGGGWWWSNSMGGRQPFERERAAYHDAVQLLQASTSVPLRLPSLWFVLDEPQPDAAVCGNTLMLSRGLLESEYLPAVLAHELGHLATSDGKLTAAINRLVIDPFPKARDRDGEPKQRDLVVVGGERFLLTVTLFGAVLWGLRRIVSFAKGGLGLRITSPFWGSYWREREYTADHYAATLGQAEELADFLEIHALMHDHPVPFIWLTEHTHPPTELRIDQLRKTSDTQVPEPALAYPDVPHDHDPQVTGQ
jgi:Zn-dependent protease with chaperone function